MMSRKTRKTLLLWGGVALIALPIVAFSMRWHRNAWLLDNAVVRIVDDSGAPVPDACVDIGWSRPGESFHMAVGPADSAGIVSLELVRKSGIALLSGYTVKLRVPGLDSVAVPLQEHNDLVLRGGRTLVARLCSAEGQRVDTTFLQQHDCHARLSWRSPAGNSRSIAWTLDDRGETRFVHAVADGSLQVQCHVDHLAISQDVPVGRDVVEIVIPADTPAITGTVYSQDGKPLPDYELSLQASVARGSTMTFQMPLPIYTDDQGRFRYFLGEGGVTGGSITVTDPGDPRVQAEMSLDPSKRPASTGTAIELGRVQLLVPER